MESKVVAEANFEFSEIEYNSIVLVFSEDVGSEAAGVDMRDRGVWNHGRRGTWFSEIEYEEIISSFSHKNCREAAEE